MKANSSHSTKKLVVPNLISQILHLYNVINSFKFPKKAGHPQKTNAREDRIMRMISTGNQFNTEAGIAHQFSAEQGTDLSRHTVSQENLD